MLKESKKHYQCEDCDRKYSFTNCAVVLNDKVWRCYECAVEKQRRAGERVFN